MTVANAIRAFFLKLNGTAPTGKTVAEVIQNGTSDVELNNETTLAARIEALENSVTSDSLILKSSTTDSEKTFEITVNDSGTVTATELDENGDPVNP